MISRIFIVIAICIFLSCENNSDKKVIKQSQYDKIQANRCNSYIDLNYFADVKQIKKRQFDNLVALVENTDMDSPVSVDNSYIDLLFSKRFFHNGQLYLKIMYPIFDGEFYVFEFNVIQNNAKYVSIILFDLNGKIQDGLCFKQMQKNKQGITNKYYTDFWYQGHLNITINHLDTLKKVIHPSLGTPICTDNWQIIRINEHKVLSARFKHV